MKFELHDPKGWPTKLEHANFLEAIQKGAAAYQFTQVRMGYDFDAVMPPEKKLAKTIFVRMEEPDQENDLDTAMRFAVDVANICPDAHLRIHTLDKKQMFVSNNARKEAYRLYGDTPRAREEIIRALHQDATPV